jgi:hypothetical protein
MSEENKIIPTFSGFDNLESTEDFIDLIRKKHQHQQQQQNQKQQKNDNTDEQISIVNNKGLQKGIIQLPVFEFPSPSKPTEPFIKGLFVLFDYSNFFRFFFRLIFISMDHIFDSVSSVFFRLFV